jgi:hypothetical protein
VAPLLICALGLVWDVTEPSVRDTVLFVPQTILQFAALKPVTPAAQVMIKLSEYSELALAHACVSVKPDVISFARTNEAETPPTVTSTDPVQPLGLHFDGLVVRIPKKQLISIVPVYPALISSQEVVAFAPLTMSDVGCQ